MAAAQLRPKKKGGAVKVILVLKVPVGGGLSGEGHKIIFKHFYKNFKNV